MLTVQELHAATIAVLAPATRNLHTFPNGTETITPVNALGVDLHDGQVGTVAHDAGRAHAYMVLWATAPTDRHTRLAGGTSMSRWAFQLTLAAGDNQRLRWALDKVRPTLSRTRLHPTTGLLTPLLDTTQIRVDEDARPSRVYVPLQYTTTVH